MIPPVFLLFVAIISDLFRNSVLPGSADFIDHGSIMILRSDAGRLTEEY